MSATTLPSGFPQILPPTPAVKKDEPAWPIAFLFPTQGNWTEDDYLNLNTNWLVEFTDGWIEVLPMPSLEHQKTVKYLLRKLDDHVEAKKLGTVVCAPLPVKIGSGKYREPDIVFLGTGRPVEKKQPVGAELVMEVVSEGEENHKRDLEIKRREYAAAGIPEYWIIDPEKHEITVLTLELTTYREHGVFRPGSRTTSVLLTGFELDVAEVFKAGTG
jgi:Uma2 family endonuclease